MKIPKIPGHALTGPEAFAAEIRSRVEKGLLPPGTKLPSTVEWARSLGVDHRLLQAGLGRLATEGILERKPRTGTVVKGGAIRKPCILVLLGWPLLPGKATFHSLLFTELKEQTRAKGYRMEIFGHALELFSEDSALRQEAIAALRETIERLNPAGYLQIAFNLNRIWELYPEFKRPVVNYSSREGQFDVGWDNNQLFVSALRYLAQQGRRKVLALRHERRINPAFGLDVFWDEARKGRFLHAEVREIFDRDNPSGDYEAAMEANGYRLMKEILAEWKTRRKNNIPDCLVVNDDVMMKGVGIALVEARVSVPEELLIVAQTNTGVERHYPVPIIKYSLPIRDAAHALVEMLDARISRKSPAKTSRLLKGEIDLGPMPPRAS